MIEAVRGEAREDTGLLAQTGRMLCCSETIYPEGSLHSMDAKILPWMGGEKEFPSRAKKPADGKRKVRGGEPWRGWTK
jgi:hypothetical protein